MPPKNPKVFLESPKLSNKESSIEIKAKPVYLPKTKEEALKDPYNAYFYARYVLKDRWPKGEPIIAKDPKYAYAYARDTIEDRFPKGESIIAKDPVWTYYYAKEVIKGRFPEGEPTIPADAYFANKYIRDILKPALKKKSISELITILEEDPADIVKGIVLEMLEINSSLNMEVPMNNKISSKDKESAFVELPNNDLSNSDLVRLALQAEYDAISLYEQIAERTDNENVKKVLLDVAKEEKTHVGEFEALLKTIDPQQEEESNKGEEEVLELTTNKNDNDNDNDNDNIKQIQKLISDNLGVISDVDRVKKIYPHVFEDPNHERERVKKFMAHKDEPLTNYPISSGERNMARLGLAAQLLAIGDVELAKEAIKALDERLESTDYTRYSGD